MSAEDEERVKGDRVKKVINAVSENPELLEELLGANNENQRKRILERRGIIERGEHGPTKEEAKKQIDELVRPVREQAGEERAVIWATGIGTAAAGAAAAFCAAE